jgi:prephenate dehydrogenase
MPIQSLKQITIVGCGLLGGSFALALRRAGFTGKITACGGTRGAKLAVEMGFVNSYEESFERDALCQADLIFLAAPISAILDFLKTKTPNIKYGAIVTDAGSTKVEICRVAGETIPKEISFIGGHPMAGSEQTGVEYSRADLFDGATWALMENASPDPEKFGQLQKIISSIGAKPLITEPEKHDAAVALISHFPQILSSILAITLKDGDDELARNLAATGWRDMTRLAGSSWSVWRDIVMTNDANVREAVDGMISQLQQVKEALEQRDFNQVRELFEAANASVEKQRKVRYRLFEKK